eukprot:gene14899-16443_t
MADSNRCYVDVTCLKKLYSVRFGTKQFKGLGAGIGRTGTVIIVDMLINQLRLKANLHSVDVPRTVEKVREQRSGMVQTELQYKFIYSVINYYAEVERKIFSLQTKGQVYSNISNEKRESSRSKGSGKGKTAFV